MACVNNDVRGNMWDFVTRYAIYSQILHQGNALTQLNFTFDRSDQGITTMAETNGNDFVQFYYLPWQNDQCITGTIPRQGANYFFTGPLNGCTIAVDKNWYNPTVGHANSNNPVLQAIDPPQMLQDLRAGMAHCTSMWSWSNDPNITVVESHDRGNIYGQNGNRDVNYNVFGYRGYTGWSFMYQVVDRYVPQAAPIATVNIST